MLMNWANECRPLHELKITTSRTRAFFQLIRFFSTILTRFDTFELWLSRLVSQTHNFVVRRVKNSPHETESRVHSWFLSMNWLLSSCLPLFLNLPCYKLLFVMGSMATRFCHLGVQCGGIVIILYGVRSLESASLHWTMEIVDSAVHKH